MLKTLWFYANALAWTTLYGSVVIVAALFGVANERGGVYDRCMHRWARRLLRSSGVPYRFEGLEKIPHGPVVFISNHQSMFDIFLLAAAFPEQTRFVAKKELTKIPLFGRAMVKVGNVTIDRQNRQAAFSAYDEAAKSILNGTRAIVFGEGTRSRSGELLPFKKAPVVLAIASGVPMVPVYCGGTFAVKPKSQFSLRRKPIALLVGDPIATAGKTYDDRGELVKLVEEEIERLRDRWERGA